MANRKLLENISIQCNFTNGGATSVNVALHQNEVFVKNLTAAPITTSSFVANDGAGVNTIPPGTNYTIRIVDASDSNLYSILDPGLFDIVASPDVVYPSVPWLNDTGVVLNAAGGCFTGNISSAAPISLTNQASNIEDVVTTMQGKYPVSHTAQYNANNIGQSLNLKYDDTLSKLYLPTYGGSTTGNSSRFRLFASSNISNSSAIHMFFTIRSTSTAGTWFAHSTSTATTNSISTTGVGVNFSNDNVRVWTADFDFSANVDFSDGNPHLIEVVSYQDPTTTATRVIVDDTHTLTESTSASAITSISNFTTLWSSNQSGLTVDLFSFDVKAGELLGTDLTDVRAWHKNQAGIP